MRDGTPTREELVAEHGEEWVRDMEELGGMDGLDLADRAFVLLNQPPYAGVSIGDAYLRARAAGECPCNLLPELFWGHWDTDGLCGMLPCPDSTDDSMFLPEGAGEPPRTCPDDEGDDPEIPF